MSLVILESLPKPRLKALLDHLDTVEDPRNPCQVAYPLREVLLVVVCGTICDCDDYDLIADGASATSASCAASCPTIMACRAGAG